MHRFFTAQTQLDGQTTIVLADKKEVHHLKNVLRLKPGDPLVLFNDQGEEVQGEIISLNSEKVIARVIRYVRKTSAKHSHVTLACALPKKAKFESIIEKTTELGVDEIFPLLTARTEIHLNPEKAQQKTQRYRQVAINAAKQCQRNSVPQIHTPMTIKSCLNAVDPAEYLILIPCLFGIRKPIRELMPAPGTKKDILIFIGPEGDFTPQETQTVQQAGGIPVSLGETVLKVDTAAISVVAFINFLNTIPDEQKKS